MIVELNKYMSEYIEKLNTEDGLKKAMKYALISNGKLIRPLVFLSLISDYNLEYKKYLSVATAIEMIHTYSLVHDDLPAMDNDDYRRGRLTVHKKFGEDIAILVGDSLLTEAFNVALDNDLDAHKKLKIITMISKCSGCNSGMINGQYLDIENDNNSELTQDVLKKIYIEKTSRLLYLSMYCALVICEKEELCEQTYEFCEDLGFLYQINDDYLDLYGKDTGKDIGSDLKNGKTTFATLYSKEELENIISNYKTRLNNVIDELKLNEELSKIVNGFGV